MKGEINTIFLTDCEDFSELVGNDGKYHYFYKIVNNLNDKFYYGIHTTNNLYDNYKGSGKLLNFSYKVHGLEYFTKYVLMFFETRKDLLNYEKKIVTEELCNNEFCYNIVKGGNGQEVLHIGVRDINGNHVIITREEFANNPDKYKHHSAGRIVINNGIKHKYIFPKDLDKYLSEGWVKGGLSRNKNAKSHIKGCVWINNGIEQQRIAVSDLDKYLSEGWVKGTCQKTTKGYIKLTNGINSISIDPNNIEQIKHYKELGWIEGITRNWKKRIWVNNGKTSNMILLSDLDKYLSEGWVKGRLKENLCSGTKGTVAINKDGVVLYIYKADLDKYLSEGWVKGNPKINSDTNSGKIVLNNGTITKFINKSDLDKYLSEGWVKGKIVKKSQKGRIRINNGIEEKFISIEDFENNYDKTIWKKGLIKPRRAK